MHDADQNECAGEFLGRTDGSNDRSFSAARGGGKGEWDSNSGVTFHMPPTHAEMTAYKKAPAGTTVEVVADGAMPVDEFKRIEVGLDQPGTTTNPVKMVAVTYIYHAQAGMTIYEKAPVGTTVEVADGTMLPIDGFGTVEVDLDQPGTTSKPVKMVVVTYVPGLSWNLLPTCKGVEQWGKPFVYYKTKYVLRFPGKKSLV